MFKWWELYALEQSITQELQVNKVNAVVSKPIRFHKTYCMICINHKKKPLELPVFMTMLKEQGSATFPALSVKTYVTVCGSYWEEVTRSSCSADQADLVQRHLLLRGSV